MVDNRGRFVWYELMTEDTKGAKAFYPKVTGWGTQDWQGPFEYTMWKAGEKPFSGLMTLPEEAKKMGAPSHWMGYVSVPNVDAYAKQATELGATPIVPPTDIPEVGRFTIIADPTGGQIALFQEKSAMDSPLERGFGEITWHELATTDLEAAWKFYSTLLGWQITQDMDMGGGMMYRMFTVAGQSKTIGGIFKKPAEMPGPTAWCYYVHIPNMDEGVSAVKANGGTILNGPMDVPGGDLIAQCMDPQGAVFALHAKAPAAKS